MTSPDRAAHAPKERIYVGLDIGYREHVAAASPLSVFNIGRNPDGWKRVKPIHFASDASGLARFPLVAGGWPSAFGYRVL